VTIKTCLRRLPFYGALGTLYRLAFNKTYRHARWLAFRRPENLFQPVSVTRADRYPMIFRFTRTALGDAPSHRLLSFGCSTGEEPLSLRRYFATSFIKGIDISVRNIKIAEKRRAHAGDDAMAFATASSTASENTASYDAIFCMAVLRHGDLADAARCDPLLRFEDFERTVGDFARCLKPGGLLVLRHSNFRFRDAASSRDFETVLRVRPNPRTPLFGRDNCRLVGAHDDEVVFRKR
jgi:2-polyprenyl-3-methyl-5-hydroxy-6-metoxy-1,4-benzoquinol methylase